MSGDQRRPDIVPGAVTIGFVGLGNVGGKLAGSVARNGFDLVVHDLDRSVVEQFVAAGAGVRREPA